MEKKLGEQPSLETKMNINPKNELEEKMKTNVQKLQLKKDYERPKS